MRSLVPSPAARSRRLALCLLAAGARAELAEINVAQQYGISYLPLMLMEEQKLIEKHAKAAGVDVKVGWAKFAGGNVMNDALLSGQPAVRLGRRGAAHHAVVAHEGQPRREGGVGASTRCRSTSTRAIRTSRRSRTSPRRTRSRCRRSRSRSRRSRCRWRRRRPSARASRASSTRSPSRCRTRTRRRRCCPAPARSPRTSARRRSSTSSSRSPASARCSTRYDVLGGPATFNVVWTTSKFRNENPKLYDAFVKALDEAIAQHQPRQEGRGRGVPAHRRRTRTRSTTS